MAASKRIQRVAKILLFLSLQTESLWHLATNDGVEVWIRTVNDRDVAVHAFEEDEEGNSKNSLCQLGCFCPQRTNHRIRRLP